VTKDAKLTSLFTPDDVLCGLRETGREACLEKLVRRLAKSGAVEDANAALEAVLARESLGSTLLSPGLAVPHARLEGLDRPYIAIATSPEGIRFRSGDEGKAKVVILVLTGSAEASEYLQVLAGIARIFKERKVAQAVAQLETPEDVWGFFEKGADALPEFVTAADIMRRRVAALHHTDTLAKAIDVFVQHKVEDIPVLDSDDDLVGIVAEEEILHLCLPEYILWLDDLKPILRFEPFNEVIKDEHVTRLAEIMSKRFVTVDEDTPAVQVARELMRQGARKVFVTRDKKLIGIITLSHFLERVFRG
jgi:mannitol/fructose-specific phosphotransferase system IIA component (Ntr-type)